MFTSTRILLLSICAELSYVASKFQLERLFEFPLKKLITRYLLSQNMLECLAMSSLILISNCLILKNKFLDEREKFLYLKNVSDCACVKFFCEHRYERIEMISENFRV